MKSIFESSTRGEITQRIHALTPSHSAHWGKMNVYQMVKHGVLSEDFMQGKIPIRRVFIGRIIGPSLLRKILRDETPFGKNSPTSPILKTHNLPDGDFEKEKADWITGIGRYENFKSDNFIHPFFGPMTNEQIGRFVYKHADHHLRQFGV